MAFLYSGLLDKIISMTKINSKPGGVQIEIQADLRAQMFEGDYKKRAGRTNPALGSLAVSSRFLPGEMLAC